MTFTVSRALANYPNRFDPGSLAELAPELRSTIERRINVLGPGYSLIYREPVGFVSGRGAHLFDAEGNDFLDAYNNVPCVGHCHPHVVEAVDRQMATLNTNTRYVQNNLVEYAERLVATFPVELSRVTFACSGSEANDLAVRVARFYTGHEGIVVTRYAYHGITRETASFSPHLGTGSPLGPNVRLIEPPDPRLVPAGTTLAEYMREQVRGAIADLERHGHGLAALITDNAHTSDGIFTDPVGYLQVMIDEAHAAGGIYIADEVQSGFARLGESMWGFQRHDVVPDIVTMGKPMANGLPLSGVVFRPEVSDEFGRNVRYFNTFGGSSVPIAAAAAVLDVLETEGVAERVLATGTALREGLREILAESEHVAEVRGAGLYIGVEIVTHRDNGTPDRSRTEAVINALRDQRILINGTGIGVNVLKIRPPLAFTFDDVGRFLDTFAPIARTHL
ncbi:aspartate aminotransferase family protein [Amycolatopsis pithecellobii]|uniref:Aminotransferase class III-fold pyridoxal phosphate-dependent enzyme n=1 Tax=Amycolatopsis pithecellobii TaxID=664692 RepID=A0A6N7YZF3_9PSEU|nr:aspartate aminotransferase family protein [Amycolatopsis pithecellobii]MTD52454.1 aminotransferase class III-fold pyridoxal phosphate-dependent enzyme [Amycolatopsis pithecellobii]